VGDSFNGIEWGKNKTYLIISNYLKKDSVEKAQSKSS